MTRQEKIRAEIEDMLNISIKKILAGADQLLAENAEFIAKEDEKAGGPMVVPKDMLVALLAREVREWGPTSTQVSVKAPSGASVWAKRSIRTINALRTRLGNMS